MRGLFDPEGKFMRYGGKLWDMMWLNILVSICSIPIITMGPALAAMHYVLLKIYRAEESGITKAFFKSFRDNLKQGIVIQTVFLAALYLLLTSMQLFGAMGGVVAGVAYWVVIVIMVVLFCTWLWTLILLSRYSNTVVNLTRSALAACLAHPFRSVLMGVFFLLPGFVFLFTDKVLLFVFVLGFTGPGFVHTLWYDPIFKKLEGAPAQSEDDQQEDAE